MTQYIEVRDAPYIGKIISKYRDRPSYDQQCVDCNLFVADPPAPANPTNPQSPPGTGTCKVIIGRVYVQGWCRYFNRMETTDAQSSPDPGAGDASSSVQPVPGTDASRSALSGPSFAAGVPTGTRTVSSTGNPLPSAADATSVQSPPPSPFVRLTGARISTAPPPPPPFVRT